MRIGLRIDELVLDGFAGADGARVGAAVEHELTRLVAARGMPRGLRAGAAIPRMGGRDAGLTRDAGDGAVGAAVARAIYGGLER